MKANNSTMEYQVKRNFRWVFVSYQTYLKDKRNGYEVRKRDLVNGAAWDNEPSLDDYKNYNRSLLNRTIK